MTHKFLLLNSDKTEVIVLGRKHFRENVSDHLVSLYDITLAFSSIVRELGVSQAFFHLRNIMEMKNTLSLEDAKKHLLLPDWTTVTHYYLDYLC